MHDQSRERTVPGRPAHEHFEREQLAQDRDARRSTLFDERFSGGRARERVEALVDDGIVTVHHAEQALTHRPTGLSFSDSESLVLFHEGWKAGQDDDFSGRLRISHE